jgi:hypothetical protein
LLAPAEGAPFARLDPGRIQLELAGPVIEAPPPGWPLEVAPIERLGNRLRVGVRLEHARFAVWTERAQLLSAMAHDQIVDTGGVPGGASKRVILREGAFVTRLVHHGDRTKIRHGGALEIEGWVPDSALADSTSTRTLSSRIPSARRTMLVTPGTIVRAEAKWTAPQLALVATGYLLETVNELADGWIEVAYADGNVHVEGFVSRRTPPGRVHTPRVDPELAPIKIEANAKAPSGTCLYARADGEPLGYLVADQDVAFTANAEQWSTLAIDTPWGALSFAVHGTDPATLASCAPDGAVPPTTLAPSGVIAP